MKRYGAAHLAILIGLALSSSKVMAQAEPDAVALRVQPVQPATVALSGLQVQPTPVVPSVDVAAVYTQPTETQKLRRFAKDAFGPLAFVKAAASGGLAQAGDTPEEWGQGWDAYRTRVASKFGTSLVSTTTRYGLAEMLREDTKYYACQCTGFAPRLGHALASTLTGRRGQDGHTVFSFPKLVSPYAGSMTSLAWLPNRFGAKDGFRMGSASFLGLVAGNLVREFLHRGPRSPLGRAESARETTVAQAIK